MISTYVFLTDDEVRVFAAKEQQYLVREAYRYNFNNVIGTQRVSLPTAGMVSNWMWYFQRDDANLRNQWSNYLNWPYDELPKNITDPSAISYNDGWSAIFASLGIPTSLVTATPVAASVAAPILIPCCTPVPCTTPLPTHIGDPVASLTPANNANNLPTDYKITGTFHIENQKEIMSTWGLIMDGKYRENTQDAGVLDYIEKYVRTAGDGQDGLYCYNFCLNTNPFDFQPSGGMNMSKFTNIQFEVTTFYPPLDPSAQAQTICNASGETIGINKPHWRIYDYTYDLVVLEERFNVLTFTSGTCGLMYAR